MLFRPALQWRTYNYLCRHHWAKMTIRSPSAFPSSQPLPTPQRRNASAAPARRQTASRCTASVSQLARIAEKTAPASAARTTKSSKKKWRRPRQPSRKEDFATALLPKNAATARSRAASSAIASALAQEWAAQKPANVKAVKTLKRHRIMRSHPRKSRKLSVQSS